MRACGCSERAPDTLQFTLTKGKNVIRLLGELDINRLTRSDVERYLDIREEEGVALATVGKELGVLRRTFATCLAERGVPEMVTASLK